MRRAGTHIKLDGAPRRDEFAIQRPVAGFQLNWKPETGNLDLAGWELEARRPGTGSGEVP